MKLRVHHRTEYSYLQPVRNNCNELRLQPVQTDWQRRAFHLMRVVPSTQLGCYMDLNGNTVHRFEIEEPHQKLMIEAQGTVETKNRYAETDPKGVSLSELSSVEGTYEVHQLLQESRYVRISPEIWRAAVDAVQGQTDVFGAAVAIMEHLHGRCTYLAGVTGTSTTSLEFFDDSRGVCQDFAHLMLAMCRSLQIPARYVSGYLYDPTRREMRGAHSSHAWCEIFVPGRGWFGLDPTNRRLVDEHYVVLAIGRDYDDVAPVKGSYYGSIRCDMSVRVHLEEV